MSFFLIILAGLLVAWWGTWFQNQRARKLESGHSDIADAVNAEAEELKLIESLFAPLKGEPSDTFEAYTACPSCKTLDYHKVIAHPPSLTRDDLNALLRQWSGYVRIDVDVLEAATKLPDDQYDQWLRHLRVVTLVKNPRFGHDVQIVAWGGDVSRRYHEPEFIQEVKRFPYPKVDFYGFRLHRVCACGRRWGQDQIDRDWSASPSVQSLFVVPSESESEATTRLYRHETDSGFPWLALQPETSDDM